MRRGLFVLLALARTAAADPAQQRAACIANIDAMQAPPYADPFSANELARPIEVASTCQGDWMRVCARKVHDSFLGATPESLARQVATIWKRYFDLDGPSRCPVAGEANSETVNQIAFWCWQTGGTRENCNHALAESVTVLEVANKQDQCAWQLGADDHKTELKAKCEQDYQAALKVEQQQEAERAQQEQQRQREQEQQREQQAKADQARQQEQAEAQAKQEQARQQHDQEVAQQHAEQAQATAANDQYTSSMVNTLASAPHGGGNEPAGASWFAHFGLGGGMFILPLFVNQAAASDGQLSVPASTDTSIAFTVGPSLRLQLWPYYAPHFGLAVEGLGELGAMALQGGGMLSIEGAVTLRGFVGNASGWSLVGEAGLGHRIVDVSQSAQFDPVVEGAKDGSASYDYTRYGLGARHCFGKEKSDPKFCEKEVTFEYLQESVPYSPDTATLYSVELHMRRVFGLSATVGFDYPTPGDNTYKGTPDHQFSLALGFEWSFDHFGAPYGHGDDEVATAPAESAPVGSNGSQPTATPPKQAEAAPTNEPAHPEPEPAPPKADPPPVPDHGTLKITSNWTDAEVLVDYTRQGTVPQDVETSTGDHLVTVRLDGFENFETHAHVEPGKTVEIRAEFPALGRLRVRSIPNRASVLINGMPAGETPFENTVPAGETVVRVEAPGYLPFEQTVTVGNRRLTMISNELKRAPDAKPAAPHAIRCASDMVAVPAGSFLMGTPKSAVKGFDPTSDEHPQHQVTLSGYCIDRTEVTVGAYQKCVAAKGCQKLEGKRPSAHYINASYADDSCNASHVDRLDHPMNCISWDDAKRYCEWARKRLPTEAEWEYAARGSDDRTYPWGNAVPIDSLLRWRSSRGTSPVGSFPDGASPFGALDMAGNVEEWVGDGNTMYESDAQKDPTGSSDTEGRMVRGGGWSEYSGSGVRSARRYARSSKLADDYVGFRCVRRP